MSGNKYQWWWSRFCGGRANSYQNAVAAARDCVLRKVSKTFIRSQSKQNIRTFSAGSINWHDNWCYTVMVLWHTFTQRNGKPGFVQMFIVVDTLSQKLNSDVWRYKIVAWNEQAKNLNIEFNHVFRFAHFKT